jgi:hypothetical protein
VPNRAAAMDARARSACYPRSTFYPLSYDPSTRDHRITRARFRDCSAGMPRSKAGLCPCTRRAVSNRAEPTFALLRYILGGDRPSQTAQLAWFPNRMNGVGLGHKNTKGGISTLARPEPEPGGQRLPPILRMEISWPVPACSKGSRGLSVLPRVASIFTGTSISPSRLLRQCSSDYAIHARQNLPDKELRYLRTGIVTAAIDWCLSRQLRLSEQADRLP